MKEEDAGLVGVLYLDTTAASFSVYRPGTAERLSRRCGRISSCSPKEGWIEQDPVEWLDALDRCVREVASDLSASGRSIADVASLAVTNQRETAVAWDRTTGAPLYAAISWRDTRSHAFVRSATDVDAVDRESVHELTGLSVSSYFSAGKFGWMLDNVAAVADACDAGTLLLGTVDSWIVWNLTGGVDGGVHATDATNASRTMLMNIATLRWEPKMLGLFNIEEATLPDIRASVDDFGVARSWSLLGGIPVRCVVGDQQAALVGHGCVRPGRAKSSCGIGCFVLTQTGPELVLSRGGLLTTVAYRIGPDPPAYALEGGALVAGEALAWMHDNLLLDCDCVDGAECSVAELTAAATGVPKPLETAGAYFVPAFRGVHTTHWRPDARGILCGLTHSTTRQHLVNAALEAVCFETREVLDAIRAEYPGATPLGPLGLDGEMAASPRFAAHLADLIGVQITRPRVDDVVSLGTALLAVAVDCPLRPVLLADDFHPTIDDRERMHRYGKWKMAVRRALGWIGSGPSPSGRYLWRQSTEKYRDKERDKERDKLVHFVLPTGTDSFNPGQIGECASNRTCRSLEPDEICRANRVRDCRPSTGSDRTSI